ncbi:MAG: helix-turn-helix transcriptional regulator [Pseudomonadota bacterium]
MLDRHATFARTDLMQRILASRAPIVVLDAVAGMGKSVLLGQLAAFLGLRVHRHLNAPDPEKDLCLWDIPNIGLCKALPDGFLTGQNRLILAKRPNAYLPGLDRAEIYGAVLRFSGRDLAFSLDELAQIAVQQSSAELLSETAGWPLLIGMRATSKKIIGGFLQTEIAANLDSVDLVRLSTALEADDGQSLSQLEILPDEIPQGIADQLRVAVQGEIDKRRGVPQDAVRLAEAFEAENRLPDAITAYQSALRFDLALQALNRGHDDFFIHIYGSTAFDKVLSGFPEDLTQSSETLMLCRAMQALKQGHMTLARRLIADWLGPAANDPSTVFAPNSGFSLKFRAFRLIMLIYEDVQVTEFLLKQIFALLDEFPLEDHLARGSFYNAVLEFFARKRRFVETEDLARRARHHYQLAKVPLLVFYISLHQAMGRLTSGDAIAAMTFAQMATAELASVPFESPSDQRLLTLLIACINYEGGKVERLARFLNQEFDEFSNGEIWPNLIELALYYGSLALSQHYSTLSARSFLDRWRLNDWRNPGLGVMMDLREVVLLQNANRWQEAAERLAALPQRISRAWVLAQTGEFARLNDRDDLAAALLWLRHLAFEGPKRAGLIERLAAVSANSLLTARQRIGVEIWTAYCHRWQRNPSAARAGLLKTLETAASLGAVAPLTEERPFLADLLGNASIASFLDASPPARQVLRKMRDAGTIKGPAGRSSGLTRQETRILQAICEGASNKFVAHAFGLSEATVKFHLGNVYAKLGCKGRKEAVRAAAALGLVA